MLGAVIRGWRERHRIGVREAATMIGLSVATLSRIENDKPAEARTLIAILDWLLHTQGPFGIPGPPGESNVKGGTMNTEIPILDMAWEQINALGGASMTSDDTAFNHGIEKALDVIESLGGKDPAPQQDEIERLRKGLRKCAVKLEKCITASGSEPEFALAAVEEYRELLGERPAAESNATQRG